MKKTLFVSAALAAVLSTAHADPVGTYGIHLYFDEREFVDTMTVSRGPDGRLTGTMHVPGDFDGRLEDLRVGPSADLECTLFVPKNAARPRDLRFAYHGRFFDSHHGQLTGFVTLAGQTDFVASFVGFKR